MPLARLPRLFVILNALDGHHAIPEDMVKEVLDSVPSGGVGLIDRVAGSEGGAPPDRLRLARLKTLRRWTEDRGHFLVVSGRADLAMAVHADGVQVPERGLSLRRLRAAFPSLLFGRSCHDRAGLELARSEGAAWAFLSPVWRPLSKPEWPLAPLGADGFASAVAGIDLPVYALGGVSGKSVLRLRGSGAYGVVCIGAIADAASPGQQARVLWQAISRGQ